MKIVQLNKNTSNADKDSMYFYRGANAETIFLSQSLSAADDIIALTTPYITCS